MRVRGDPGTFDNTYFAGHHIGYPGTGSFYVFFHLDWQTEGDRIILHDAAGEKYLYRVTEKLAVTPDNVEVMEPKDGESLDLYPARFQETPHYPRRSGPEEQLISAC
ncbi:MAG TPA: sortase [Rubrobacter sp.]